MTISVLNFRTNRVEIIKDVPNSLFENMDDFLAMNYNPDEIYAMGALTDVEPVVKSFHGMKHGEI